MTRCAGVRIEGKLIFVYQIILCAFCIAFFSCGQHMEIDGDLDGDIDQFRDADESDVGFCPRNIQWIVLAGDVHPVSPAEDVYYWHDRLIPSQLVPLDDEGFIVSGNYSGRITLGVDSVNEITYEREGDRVDPQPSQSLLARYGADGHLIWSRVASSRNGGVTISRIRRGMGDRLLVVGNFREGTHEGTPVFSPYQDDSVTLEESEGSFLAVYSVDGDLLWVKTVAQEAEIDGVIENGDGTLALWGTFQESAVFGLDGEDQIVLESSLNSDGFFAVYDSEGHILSARSIMASENLIYTLQGEPFPDGGFLFFGKNIGGIDLYSTDGDVRVDFGSNAGGFLFSRDADDSIPWAIGLLAEGDSFIGDLALLPESSFVITGVYEDEIVFGAGEPTETVLRDDEESGFYLAQYGYDGSFQWVRSARSDMSVSGASVESLSTGALIVTGFFGDLGASDSSVSFGEGDDGEVALHSSEESNFFVSCHDPEGAAEWAMGGGSEWREYGVDIAVFPDDSFVVLGLGNGVTTFQDVDGQEHEFGGEWQDYMFMIRFAR